jgi:GNAT superfamily N-acetyltransferase
VKVEPAFWDDPDVQRLAADQQIEVRARYGADDVAEVKRMYVDPSARGRGVAKAVLEGLEGAARERGWTTLRLATGPCQPEAFGAYVGAPDAAESLFFEWNLEPR